MRTVSSLLLAAAILSVLAITVSANVMPEALFRWNVRSTPDPQFCANNPITSCNQLNRYTTATGTVEFDLFLDPVAYHDDHLPIHSLEATLVWPPSWQVTGYTICSGIGEFSHDTGALIAFYPGTVILPDGLFLVARFEVLVPDEGTMNIADGSQVALGWGPDYLVLSPHAIDGQAGVVCSGCGTVCGYADYCRARFDPGTVNLFVESGGSTTFGVNAFLDEPAGPGTCQEAWTTDQSWLRITQVSDNGWGVYNLDIEASAAGLPAGLYEGFVRGDRLNCRGCGLVRLNVTGTSSLPESHIQTSTWGAVKRLYR